MVFDVADAADQIAVAFGKVASQQVLHKALKLGVEALWISRFSVDDLLVNVHWIIIDEGSVASMHLID